MSSTLNSLKISSRFEDICREYIPGFVVDEYNEQVIENLKKYIDRDPSCAYHLDKGICLMGNPGSGKTELLRAMQKLYIQNNHPLVFGFSIVWQVAEDFSNSGWELLTKFKKGNWFLDELGRREKEITGWMHYKNVDMADVLIQRRHKLFKDFQLLTHWTTNKSDQELKEALDWATYSRLQEMSNFIPLIGPDRRKKSVLKPVFTEKIEKEVSKAEKKKIDKELIRDRILIPYKEFVQTGELNLPIAEFFIYDMLDKMKVIQISEERKKEISKNARERVKAKNWKDFSFRMQWENKDPIIIDKIQMECKSIALREFLTECKTNGVALDKIIEKKMKQL